VAYGWGWGNAPWFYGGYFAPAPFYSSAALWLTDFVLAENLKLAYDNQMAASGQGQPEPQAPLAQENSAALTPEVKQLIADEVQQQLAAEQAAAAQPASLEPTAAVAVPDAPPPALDPRIKVFVVSTGLNLSAGSDGQTCALTPGDVIERTGRNVSADGQVPVGVLDSKEGDCRSILPRHWMLACSRICITISARRSQPVWRSLPAIGARVACRPAPQPIPSQCPRDRRQP
jgi:hypothetical protein